MSATKRRAGPDTGALGYKIETAEACGGVVTLSAGEARLLKDAVLQRGVLLAAAQELHALLNLSGAVNIECDKGVSERFHAAEKALRAAINKAEGR